MLVANHVITILSLLPLSLSVILQPALNHFMPQRAAFHELLDRDEKVTARNMRWMPRKRSMGSNGTKRPVIRAGGLELELHRREPRRRELGRRAMGNGSIIDLGTALE